jgi:vacuolar protein sorting-associated protein 41
MSTPQDSARPSEGSEADTVSNQNENEQDEQPNLRDSAVERHQVAGDESNSGEVEEEDDDEDDEDEEDDEEEEEEPKLRYNRIKSSVAETLTKDAASVLRVSMRFVVSFSSHFQLRLYETKETFFA